MARERQLKVKVVGEDAGAGRTVRGVRNDLEALGPAGEKASGMLGRVTGVLETYGGAVGQRASNGLQRIVGGISALPPVASAATAGVGALVAGVGALAAQGVTNFVNLASEVRNFQRASGASAEESSRFVAVLDDMGIAAETGAAAVFKLAKNADSTKLREFGIELERTKDGNVDVTETLLNVADAYVATNDPARRAEIAFAAFGKQGQQLIPVLEQGRKGLQAFFKSAEDSGQILSQEDLQKARDYELAMDDLGDAVAELQRELGGGLVSGIADVASAMAKGIGFATDLADKVGGVENIVKGAATAIPGVGLAMTIFGRGSKDAADKQAELEATTEGASAALEEQASEAGNAASALKDLLAAQTGLIDATLSLEGANDRLQGAVEDYATKQREAAEAVRLYGADSEQARAATEALDDATLSLKEAADAQAKASAEQTAKQLEANGVLVSGEQRTALYKERLLQVASTIGGPVGQALRDLANGIKDVPDQKSVQLLLNAAQALAELREFNRAMAAAGLSTRQVSIGVEPEFTSRDSQGRAVKRRHGGGPVTAGEPYLVGEHGTEQFVPAQDGQIVPAHELNGGGQALELTVVIPIDGEVVARRTFRFTLAELEAYWRRRGGMR